MRCTTCLVGIALSFCVSGQIARGADATPADRLFARLKTLAGEWEGRYEWTGQRTGGGELRVVYRVTGGGSAVVEDLIMGGKPTMTSVYHVDGGELRMTHYCAAQNQPRLRSTHIDEATASAEFGFVDITPAGAAAGGHVHGFFIQLLGGDRLNLRFTFTGSKGDSVENILVRRAAPAKARL